MKNNFVRNIFRKRIQVQSEDLKNNNTTKGKHYAISDIHGMYGSYIEVIKKLNKEDHLYIVGDVIDRGEDGIKILLDIMERQKNPGEGPQITFLIGNHEVMFLSTIVIMLNHDWKGNEFRDLMECDDVEEFIDIMKNRGIRKNEIKYIYNWIKRNQGDKTIFKYLQGIGPYKMKEIYNFLLESYAILPEKIGKQDFLFVHAMPIDNKEKLEQMKLTGKGYKITELTPKEYTHVLTEREKENYELAKEIGFTTICGHTPDLGTIKNRKDKGFVRIDAGCGHKKKDCKLALYCIEDDKVEYIDEIQESNKGEYR